MLQFVALLFIICSLQHSFGFVKTAGIRLKPSFSYDLNRSVRNNDVISAVVSGDGIDQTRPNIDQLRGADVILRGILLAGQMPEMEVQLAYHLKREEIDIAFMVILQLNTENCVKSGADTAADVLTHLNNVIREYKDFNASP
jgi:hypothetical protein